MRQHHTKNKGDLGVFKAQADLCEQGYTVLVPLTEHEEFDLVAYKDGVFKRVQVKYREAKNNTVSVGLSTSWADKHGNHSTHYTNIDVLCVFCPSTDECYYVSFADIKDNAAVTIRLTPTKNNQRVGIKMASDYRIFPG